MAALAATVCACGPVDPQSASAEGVGAGRPSILMLVADATHAAYLGAYGSERGLTPGFDAVAREGAVFRRAFSNANWTLPSTACLLTGRLQEQHGVVSRDHRVSTAHALLPEVLRSHGYRTAAFVEMGYAHPTYGFGRGFDDFTYYGAADSRAHGDTVGSIVEDPLDWIEGAAGEPWFVYVHARRPHSPYNPPEMFLEVVDPDGPLADGELDGELRGADAFGRRVLPEPLRERVEALYLANLMVVDRAVERFVAAAREQDAFVFLTSDHGEALGDDGVFGHGIHLADDNIDVPLIVVGPEVVAAEHRAPVCTVDFFPTILELVGLPTKAIDGLAGRSFAPLLRGDGGLAPRPPVISSGKHFAEPGLQVALVDAKRKVVVETDGSVAWYRRTDRGDVALERPPDAAKLERRARAWAREHESLADQDRVDTGLDDGLLEDLELLGYRD